MKCFRLYKGAMGIFFQIIYIYHFTHREKPIMRLYDRWVVLCTVKNLNSKVEVL
jgi:hypothetical protein